MSVFGQVKFADSTNFDSFGRLKVIQPTGQFDFISIYGDNTYLWESQVTGTGSVSAPSNSSVIRLSTGGTGLSAGAIRQTKQYFRYHPGRSLNIEQTFVMSSAQANVLTSIGYFDAHDGIFFSRNGSVLQFTQRSYIGGSASDTTILQSSWNVDKFDGTGPSGVTLDVTKANILFIDFQYLGVGRVRVGFVVNGIFYVAHQFLNANSISTPYMSTPNLPIRGSILNTGVGGGTTTLDMICETVHTGGVGIQEQQFAASNGITTIATSTTLLPVVSIRAATLLGGTTGGGSYTNRSHIVPTSWSIFIGSQNHEARLILNPTLTGPSWNPVASNSFADFDVAATALSGGLVLDCQYISSTTANGRNSIYNGVNIVIPLVYSGLLNEQDILTVAVRSFTGAGTATGSILWKEPF